MTVRRIFAALAVLCVILAFVKFGLPALMAGVLLLAVNQLISGPRDPA